MSSTLIPVKSFLGKYYTELLYSSAQDKYKSTDLDTLFDQRFQIQGNKVQMIVDPALTGLSVVVSGNEILISKELYDHKSVIVVNSIESGAATNPKSLYNSETFSTVAYLVCQNHTTFQIIDELDEPIYIKYRSDFETFYNSVVVFDISNDLEIEIVEEIESLSALNSVTNYLLHPSSKLDLTTFYQNHVSGISIVYRNVIAQEGSEYNHILFGKGSSNVIDETKIHASEHSRSQLRGLVNSASRNFHSILYVDPESTDYHISVDYRNVLHGKSNVTFYPAIVGELPGHDIASIVVSNIELDKIPLDQIGIEVSKYIADIMESSVLTRMVGAKRFYDNKSKFLNFP